MEKYLNIKFRENLSIGNRVVPCDETDRRIDMTKLIVAFGNLASAPKKSKISYVSIHRARGAYL